MAKTIAGNNKTPTNWLTTQYIEVEDDDGEYYEVKVQAESIDEETIDGYKFITPKASDSATVKLGYYYNKPTSEWYWEYIYGDPPGPIYPLVFSCNSSWKPTECLNVSIPTIRLDTKASGWITSNVTLKRKLQKNERIFFGFYGYIMPLAWSKDTVTLGSVFYVCPSKQYYTYKNNLPDFFTTSEFFNNISYNDFDTNYSIYLEYENEVESVSYTRTVTAKYIPGTSVIRKGNFMRKENSYIRNSELVSRFRIVTCSLYSEAKAYSSVSKLRFLYRLINENENFIDDVKRCLKINTLIVDKKEFSDELIRNLIIGRCITAGILTTDFLERTADYKRINKTKPEITTLTKRITKTFRNNVDSVLFSVFVIPSRIFYRTVQTIVSFWDWLKGKIRETNNIVSFFCPVDLEIKLECKV